MEKESAESSKESEQEMKRESKFKPLDDDQCFWMSF